MGVPLRAIFTDMDDTLVMTGEADIKAYADVMRLACELHEKVVARCIVCQL